MKARQDKNGQFVKVPYGQTEYVGDSVAERDAVVARMFNYCILVEGGPSSARVAEEFVWNDKVVIPVMCTGGAAAGRFDGETSIIDMPAGVNNQDWNMLERRDVTADEIANAILHMLLSLSKSRCLKACQHRKSEKWFGNLARHRKPSRSPYKGNKKQSLLNANT